MIDKTPPDRRGAVNIRNGKKRVRILLSNDDGYFAPGLAALERALSPLGQVTVVAPEALLLPMRRQRGRRGRRRGVGTGTRRPGVRSGPRPRALGRSQRAAGGGALCTAAVERCTQRSKHGG